MISQKIVICSDIHLHIIYEHFIKLLWKIKIRKIDN